jgi:hypothetical protein
MPWPTNERLVSSAACPAKSMGHGGQNKRAERLSDVRLFFVDAVVSLV